MTARQRWRTKFSLTNPDRAGEGGPGNPFRRLLADELCRVPVSSAAATKIRQESDS